MTNSGLSTECYLKPSPCNVKAVKCLLDTAAISAAVLLHMTPNMQHKTMIVCPLSQVQYYIEKAHITTTTKN